MQVDGTAHLVSRERTVYALPDPFGNIVHKETTVEDAAGIVSRSTFDSTFDIRDGDPWLISLPERVTTTDDRLRDNEPEASRTVLYEFDDLGLIERAVREPDADPDASSARGVRQETVYHRNPNDPFRVVRKITTSGDWRDENDEPVRGERVTSIEYDGETMFPRHVYRHHGANNCSFSQSHTEQCQTTDVSYDFRDGTLITRVDPTGIGERMEYDPFGRLTLHESAADTVRVRYEDAVGAPSPFFPIFPKMQITATSEKTGAKTTRRLDSLGRTVQTETLGIAGAVITQEFEYLTGGLVTRASRPHLRGDASQGTVQQRYDARFRPFDRIFPDSTFIEFQYAPAALLQSTLGAEPGETTARAVIDQNGRRTVTFTDARGVTRRRVDPKGNSVRYEFRAFDELARVIEPIAGEPDHVTRIVTDRIGRVLLHEDGDSGRTLYAYTAFDDIAVQHDNLDRATGLHYDDLGRLERIDSSTSAASTHFAYDGPGENAIGRLVETVSQDGAIERYTYEAPPASDDPTENRGFPTSVDRVIAGVPFTTSFRYNDKSQLDRITYPPTATSAGDESFRVHYGYDGAGNLVCVSNQADPAPGDCTEDRFWKLEEAFQGHRVQKESFGNGVTTTYGFDDFNGYLRSINTARGSTAYQSITYPLYDDKGNLRRRIQTLRAVNGNTSTVDESFEYDQLDRLTDVVSNGAAPFTLQHLEYSDNGNILDKADVGAYEYTPRAGDPLRAPHAVRAIKRSGNEVAKFTYDAVGNMTKREGEGVDGGVQTFDYTWFNLPETIVVGNGSPGFGAKEIHYDYDASQRRVHATIESDGDAAYEEQRFYAGDLYERVDTEDEAGSVTRHLYKVFAAGRQIAQVQREVRFGASVETRRYIHADQQGSSQLITNESGEIAHVQRFDAFGKPIGPVTGSADLTARNIRAGFTGHESDVETGLVNMRGRLYDPRLGRFMQADPIIEFSSAQELNRYSYVLNNPLNLIDPDGLQEEDEGGDQEDDFEVPEGSEVTETGDWTFVTTPEGDLVAIHTGPSDAIPTASDSGTPDAPDAPDVATSAENGDPHTGGVNEPSGADKGGDTGSGNDSGNSDDAGMGDDEEAENPQADTGVAEARTDAGSGEDAGTGGAPNGPDGAQGKGPTKDPQEMMTDEDRERVLELMSLVPLLPIDEAASAVDAAEAAVTGDVEKFVWASVAMAIGKGGAKVAQKVLKLKPGQKVGGGGKPISPTAVHKSKKAAQDAAQAETAKGQAPVHHKAEKGNPPHYHAVDSKGNLKPKHHDYPKR